MRCFLLLIILVLCGEAFSQSKKVTVSGTILEKKEGEALPYVNVVIKNAADSTFVGGTVTNDQGLFSIGGVSPGDYVLEGSLVGFKTRKIAFLVGRLSD